MPGFYPVLSAPEDGIGQLIAIRSRCICTNTAEECLDSITHSLPDKIDTMVCDISDGHTLFSL